MEQNKEIFLIKNPLHTITMQFSIENKENTRKNKTIFGNKIKVFPSFSNINPNFSFLLSKNYRNKSDIFQLEIPNEMQITKKKIEQREKNTISTRKYNKNVHPYKNKEKFIKNSFSSYRNYSNFFNNNEFSLQDDNKIIQSPKDYIKNSTKCKKLTKIIKFDKNSERNNKNSYKNSENSENIIKNNEISKPNTSKRSIKINQIITNNENTINFNKNAIKTKENLINFSKISLKTAEFPIKNKENKIKSKDTPKNNIEESKRNNENLIKKKEIHIVNKEILIKNEGIPSKSKKNHISQIPINSLKTQEIPKKTLDFPIIKKQVLSSFNQYIINTQDYLKIKENPLKANKNKIIPLKNPQNNIKMQSNEIPLKNQENYTKNKEIPIKNQENYTKNKETPIKNQANYIKNKQIPIKNQPNLIKNQEIPIKNQPNYIKNQENPLKMLEKSNNKTLNPINKYLVSAKDYSNPTTYQIKSLEFSSFNPEDGSTINIYREAASLNEIEKNEIIDDFLKDFIVPKEFYNGFYNEEKTIDFENKFFDCRNELLKEISEMYKIAIQEGVSGIQDYSLDLIYELKKCRDMSTLLHKMLNIWSRQMEQFFRIINIFLFSQKNLHKIRYSSFLLSLNYNQLYQNFEQISTVYRMDDFVEAEKLKKNDIFSNSAFWCTSKSSKIKKNSNFKRKKNFIIIDLFHEEGENLSGFFNFLDISSFSDYPQEHEVLILPFCQFRVENISFNSNKFEIKIIQMYSPTNFSQSFFLLQHSSLYSSLKKTFENDKNLMKIHLRIIEEKMIFLAKKQSKFKEGMFLNKLASILINLNQNKKAIAIFQNVLSIYLEFFDQNDENIANIYNNIAVAYCNLGEFSSSLILYEKSMKIYRKSCGEDSPKLAHLYINIANLYENLKDFDKAIEFYSKAMEINKKNYEETHQNMAIQYNNMANAFVNKNMLEKALEFYSKSLEIVIKHYGETHTKVADCYNNISQIYYRNKEIEKVKEIFWKIVEIDKKNFGEKSDKVASDLAYLASIEFSLQKFQESYKIFNQALEIYLEFVKENKDNCEGIVEKIACIYKNLGVISIKLNQEKSIFLFEKSSEFYNSIDNKTKEIKKDLADIYQNLTVLNSQNNFFEKALENCKKALEIKEILLENDDNEIISLKNNKEKLEFIIENIENANIN